MSRRCRRTCGPSVWPLRQSRCRCPDAPSCRALFDSSRTQNDPSFRSSNRLRAAAPRARPWPCESHRRVRSFLLHLKAAFSSQRRRTMDHRRLARSLPTIQTARNVESKAAQSVPVRSAAPPRSPNAKLPGANCTLASAVCVWLVQPARCALHAPASKLCDRECTRACDRRAVASALRTDGCPDKRESTIENPRTLRCDRRPQRLHLAGGTRASCAHLRSPAATKPGQLLRLLLRRQPARNEFRQRFCPTCCRVLSSS